MLFTILYFMIFFDKKKEKNLVKKKLIFVKYKWENLPIFTFCRLKKNEVALVFEALSAIFPQFFSNFIFFFHPCHSFSSFSFFINCMVKCISVCKGIKYPRVLCMVCSISHWDRNLFFFGYGPRWCHIRVCLSHPKKKKKIVEERKKRTL